MTLKIVLIGGKAGKSSILHRLTKNKFQPADCKATIGCDFCLKELNGIETQLWDVSSMECSDDITRLFFKGAAGFVLVAAADSIDTLDQLREAAISIKRGGIDLSKTPCLVLLSKTDLPRNKQTVSLSDVETLMNSADEFHGFVFSSAAPIAVTSAPDSSQKHLEDVFTDFIQFISGNNNNVDSFEKKQQKSVVALDAADSVEMLSSLQKEKDEKKRTGKKVRRKTTGNNFFGFQFR